MPLLLKRLKPARANFLVRTLRWFYMVQLRLVLKIRWLTLLAFLAVLGVTGFVAIRVGAPDGLAVAA